MAQVAPHLCFNKQEKCVVAIKLIEGLMTVSLLKMRSFNNLWRIWNNNNDAQLRAFTDDQHLITMR